MILALKTTPTWHSQGGGSPVGPRESYGNSSAHDICGDKREKSKFIVLFF